ncbi:MAG: TetR/AcrR family transcriptional regulator [Pseudomonadota bacterium]
MSDVDTALSRKKPLGRRERKKLETRFRILNAALKLMAERGYDSVKIEEIAAEADIANATFFLHFPNKSSLIGAFTEQIAEKIEERLAGFEFAAIEQLEILRAIVLDEWSQYAELLRGLLADAPAGQPTDSEHANAGLTALVTEIIKAGQASGEFSSDVDADIAAECLTASWRAGFQRWSRDGDKDRALLANRQALDILLNGIAVG